MILNGEHSKHVVSRMTTTEHPIFHRPLGGSVEIGERSAQAVVREIREELGATLVEPQLLGVLENLFMIDGESGHEVVFVYAGGLAEDGVVPPDGCAFMDIDVRGWVEWRPIAGDPTVPLFPDGLQELIDDWLTPR